MDFFEERKEWLKIRRGKITASEVHKLLKGGSRPMTNLELVTKPTSDKRKTVDTLFGEGALTYIDEIVNGIISGETKQLEGIAALEWGFMYEEAAIMQFIETTGHQMEYFGAANPKFFEYNPVAGGSPDGLSLTHVGEIKCPYNGSNHVCALREMRKGRDGNDFLKWFNEKYYAQVQFNMLACNKYKSYFISYDPRPVVMDLRLAYFEINRDIVFQSELITRIDAATDLIIEDLKLFKMM